MPLPLLSTFFHHQLTQSFIVNDGHPRGPYSVSINTYIIYIWPIMNFYLFCSTGDGDRLICVRRMQKKTLEDKQLAQVSIG
ncbi:uncharacterized protein BP01DRAFT_179153 [Aspergillus saccharolyticus JOP 1030-1]|uniref:Uncharacterized protein n=1 Tax=Aspergillus saccharolyticus JOP 1030-1 TaxID=1450539 RepID=A0A318ZL72_9EURO|nr:hypothetical protein BP01DRAFT_179153 [Aspergillus saccharolyticus JOP 1030-1]PYH48256.1 hypothetical protein BP01DRAFT_179153 [Aspergillus saccharolyticus JOP 1030-1]